jgi:anaphase-promoting complex subunit 2
MLLDVISHPIRSYLRSRPDTIRCIVSLLTGDTGEAVHGQASLLEELQQQAQQGAGTQGSQQLPGSFSGTAIAAGGLGADISGPGHCFRYNWCTSEQEGEEAALKLLEALEAGADWAPEESSVAAEQSGMLGLPVCPSSASTAALMGPAGGRVEADVVSMLIGIYGGPLLFMEQYRQMLADRLLAKDEYDCEKEIRTLELLKIRWAWHLQHAVGVFLGNNVAQQHR